MATKASGKSILDYDPARCAALSEVLAESWWLVGLRGILGIVFGLICLLNPTLAVEVFVILFAAYMLVDGVFSIFSGIKAASNGERWGLLILEGVVDLAAGAVAVLWPAITLVALVWVIAIWAIVSGGLMLAAAFGLNLESRPLVACPCRHRFGHLRHIVGHRAADRRRGADHVDRCLCPRIRRVLLVLAFQLHSRREEHKHKTPAAAAKKA